MEPVDIEDRVHVDQLDEDLPKASDGGLKRTRTESLLSILKSSPQVVNGCKKRKLYHPQQHSFRQEDTTKQQQPSAQDEWKSKVSEMQAQLAAIQRKLMDTYKVQSAVLPASRWQEKFNYVLPIEPVIGNTAACCNIDCITSDDWKCLAESLKVGMSSLIDDWVRQYGSKLNDETALPPKMSPNHKVLRCQEPQNTILESKPIRLQTQIKSSQPVFQSPSTYFSHFPRPSTPDNENVPISLVVSPKKRRCKVTDKTSIRTHNRFVSQDEDSTESSVPMSLATSVAIPNPSLVDSSSSRGNFDMVIRTNSPDSSPFKNNDSGDFSYDVHSTTLTPLHLRKAKLMFFYLRYPSSSVLKENFPDIKFNKNNTAQLVKWFSNFREFYYIQMEKYARQALSEGCQSSGEITVSVDSEIYRVLTLHYNRNNHIKVPFNFRSVVEQTLREFFVAISTGKNNEPSWKKVIYKVIARLDDNLPEFFKSSNFLDQLE